MAVIRELGGSELRAHALSKVSKTSRTQTFCRPLPWRCGEILGRMLRGMAGKGRVSWYACVFFVPGTSLMLLILQQLRVQVEMKWAVLRAGPPMASVHYRIDTELHL